MPDYILVGGDKIGWTREIIYENFVMLELYNTLYLILLSSAFSEFNPEDEKCCFCKSMLPQHIIKKNLIIALHH